MSNAWYEVLSVLHLMAMLSLSQANLLLLPRISADGYQPKVSDGRLSFHISLDGKSTFMLLLLLPLFEINAIISILGCYKWMQQFFSFQF